MLSTCGVRETANKLHFSSVSGHGVRFYIYFKKTNDILAPLVLSFTIVTLWLFFITPYDVLNHYTRLVLFLTGVVFANIAVSFSNFQQKSDLKKNLVSTSGRSNVIDPSGHFQPSYCAAFGWCNFRWVLCQSLPSRAELEGNCSKKFFSTKIIPGK